MKNNYLLKCVMVICLGIISAFTFAQNISDFENLTLTADTYYDGSDLSGGFSSGDAYFPNYYDTAWGGYWSGGFAYSNMQDNTTPGFLNMYSAMPGVGVNGSMNYIIGKNGSEISFNGATQVEVHGMYVSNTSYAAIAMQDGDAFAKQFGGSSGDDKDWFMITVAGYSGGTMGAGVDFYLADYRFDDNNLDYIVTDWQWMDLSSLGPVDSLNISIDGSDVGAWGINTPAFYAIDNFNDSINPIVVMGAVVNDECDNGTGSVDASATTGTAPFTYIWSTGNTTAAITGLNSGVYDVTVTDNNGDLTFTSLIVDDLRILTDIVAIDASCNGAVYSYIEVTGTSATGPYSYIWATGETTNNVSVVAAQIYVCTITTALGCETVESFTITEPSSITVTSAMTFDSGVGDGAIDITVTGGTAPYSFVWSNTATTEDIDSLSGGQYMVDVMDAHGCTLNWSDSVIVSGLAASPTDVVPLRIYPNPAKESIYLQVALDEVSTLSIFDVNGKMIHTRILYPSNGLHTMSTSSIGSGIYFVSLKSASTNQISRLIIE